MQTLTLTEIENKFGTLVDSIADEIDRGDAHEFEVESFEKFRPFITNWDTLLEAIEEENDAGPSELWESVEFAHPNS
jgi:hypothetical protein